MRNPITGLGPAAYRPYARMKPLQYERAFYALPAGRRLRTTTTWTCSPM